MMPRFKLIVAALGLVVATATIGDATAMTVVKSVTTHTFAGTRTAKIITQRPNRIVARALIVRHPRIIHRAPVSVRAPLVVKKVVRVTRWPHLAAHRVVAKTIVR